MLSTRDFLVAMASLSVSYGFAPSSFMVTRGTNRASISFAKSTFLPIETRMTPAPSLRAIERSGVSSATMGYNIDLTGKVG